MQILKFPRFKKVYSLKVKVKCDKCSTHLLIDDIDDVTINTGVCWEYDPHNINVYNTTCPYCNKKIPLLYNKCKQIDDYIKCNGIDINDIKQEDYNLPPIDK